MGADIELMANHIQQVLRRGMAGSTFDGYNLDQAHPGAWRAYGYPTHIEFAMYFSMYSRSGTAQAYINMLPDKCWSVMPTIAVDPNNPDDKLSAEIKRLDRKHGLRQVLARLDKVQSVGRYGGLFLELRDGIPLDQPAGRVRPIDGLQAMKVLYEGQLRPNSEVTDQTSPLYGTPISYEINENNTGDNNDRTGRTGTVDASRVIVVAEDSNGPNDIYGVPALRCVFNSLITMEKIIGAGGEGFFKNAKGMQQFKLDPGMDMQQLMQFYGTNTAEETRQAFQDAYTMAIQGFNSALLVNGADGTPLQMSMPDSSSHLEAAKLDVASGRGYPSTILFGQQTGRLASDQDQIQMNEVKQMRQEGFCTQVVRKVVDGLMAVGAITPAKDYEVVWPDPFSPSAEKKIANFKALMESFRGSATPVDPSKLAKMAGFDEDEIEPLVDMLGFDSGESELD